MPDLGFFFVWGIVLILNIDYHLAIEMIKGYSMTIEQIKGQLSKGTYTVFVFNFFGSRDVFVEKKNGELWRVNQLTNQLDNRLTELDVTLFNMQRDQGNVIETQNIKIEG